MSLHLHQSLPLHLVLHFNLYDIVHAVGGPHLTWMYDSANTSVISCRPRARACALSTGIYNKGVLRLLEKGYALVCMGSFMHKGFLHTSHPVLVLKKAFALCLAFRFPYISTCMMQSTL